MDLNIRAIVRVIGLLMVLTACCMMLPLLVGFYYGELDSVKAFLSVIIPAFALGSSLVMVIKAPRGKLKNRDGYIIVALCWLFMSLIGALPFVIQGCIPSYADAFFETCSGFSTTGSTIIPDLTVIPQSMLFWRSFTHWVGGMGILVLAVALLPALGISGQLIASNESPGPTFSKTTAKVSDMAKSLYLIYTVFTVVEIVLLMFGGMSLFDAAVQTFGTVGTGGFSNYGDSIAHFHSPYCEWVITIFMIASGANFNLYYFAATKSIRTIWQDSEFRLYIYIISAFSLLIALDLVVTGTVSDISDSIRAGFFQVASIITTTGFATTDFDLWPTFCKMMLFALFFIGGCSSSTGGGIKVCRVLVLLKLIKRNITTKLHPNVLYNIKVDGKIVDSEVIQGITSFTFLYIVCFFVVSLLISVDGFDIVTTLSAAGTCLGNIGPGFAKVGPVLNFAAFSDFSKWILSFTMIAGRLELFTLFMLFSRRFWNPYH